MLAGCAWSPVSAVSLTGDDRFEQKKVFVESATLAKGSPRHPARMELRELVRTDFMTVFTRKNQHSGEERQEKRPLLASCTAGRALCTKQLN